ncbi:MAG TPA: hybrid sensor histidine kinase/response regulator [Verrucomicrobiae bacterium]|nr:hybrid sensor histidine kinase/response regulator [Verrucomicrobiae bacterium]
MQAPQYDYKKFAILYVDDEEKSLKYFARAFEEQFRILTASNAQEGLKALEQHPDDIALLMTDQRMPGEKGVWLLERARQLRPRMIRILVTAYSDMDAAIAAVNTGAIYRYVTKPWDPPQIEATLKRGLEFFMVQRERDQLLREKTCVLRNAMIADRIVSLGLMAAGLSHHIRNSLVAVKTFLDLAPSKLREENLDVDALRNPDFWKDYYHHVQSQLCRINSLLRDLWTASEPPSAQFPDQVNIHELVGDIVTQLSPKIAAKKIEVTNQIPSGLPALKVDRPKFQRLFELLIQDELVSLPVGATITFTASTRPGARPEESEIQVEMKDNGPGLPAEALRLIFDPFVIRADTPAEYGINLMACYFIVHHHGGRIEARTEQGRGTTFTLFLTTNPEIPTQENGQQFLEKVFRNEQLWEKLITAD